MEKEKDCLECRVVGSGAMAALAAHFALNARAADARRAPPVSPGHGRVPLASLNKGLALAFAAAALARALV